MAVGVEGPYGRTIILIGPFGAGKSTIAEILSERLEIPTESLDRHQEYYKEAGFDGAEFRRLLSGPSGVEADLYFQRFFPYAVEKILRDYPGCIIDLGAGHTVYQDEALFERVKRVLEPYRNVVLILPSPNPDESVRVLRERAQEKMGADHFLNSSFDFFSHWVKSPNNAELANVTVYTEGKTPEQTAEEVTNLASVGLPTQHA